MGTNYFVRPEGACKTRCDNWLHLGQTAAGWQFAFQAYPPDPMDQHDGRTVPVVENYESWLKLLDLGEIYDEYGRQLTRDDMIHIIESVRRDGRPRETGTADENGHAFVTGWFS